MFAIVVLIAFGITIWLAPVPANISPQIWHMFAIFAATIAAILTQPLSSGAVADYALRGHFTQTLTEAKALSVFASGTVWLIFCAYILSLGFITSGLSKRITYKMLSLFGRSSLSIAYLLGIYDFIIASAIPAVTARSVVNGFEMIDINQHYIDGCLTITCNSPVAV
ncbi:MAG: anion permease [Candidatus Malihini olakiniferum]